MKLAGDIHAGTLTQRMELTGLLPRKNGASAKEVLHTYNGCGTSHTLNGRTHQNLLLDHSDDTIQCCTQV